MRATRGTAAARVTDGSELLLPSDSFRLLLVSLSPSPPPSAPPVLWSAFPACVRATPRSSSVPVVPQQVKPNTFARLLAKVRSGTDPLGAGWDMAITGHQHTRRG